MKAHLSRRRMMQAAATIALGSSAIAETAAAKQWPIAEGADTPKLCLGVGDGGRATGDQEGAGMRRIKQLGVDYVLGGGPR
ncbi:MAG: hypothetical protein JSW27_09205, partial [Phycisphaerales bacterium]